MLTGQLRSQIDRIWDTFVDRKRHTVIESSHPSLLSATRPCGSAPAFFQSRPFSRANAGLVDSIDWSLSW